MDVGREETVVTSDSNYGSRHILPAQVKQRSPLHTKHKIKSPQNKAIVNGDVLNVKRKSLNDRVRNAQERSLERDLQVNGMDYMRHQQGNVGQSRVSVIRHADTRDDPILNQAVLGYTSSDGYSGCSGLRTSPSVIGPQHGEQNLLENSMDDVEYGDAPYGMHHAIPEPEQGYLGHSPGHCYPKVRPYRNHGMEMNGHDLNYLDENHPPVRQSGIIPQYGQGHHHKSAKRSRVTPQESQGHQSRSLHPQHPQSAPDRICRYIMLLLY